MLNRSKRNFSKGVCRIYFGVYVKDRLDSLRKCFFLSEKSVTLCVYTKFSKKF